MSGTLYGYSRGGLTRPMRAALDACGCVEVFYDLDKAGPAWSKLMDRLVPGDTVVIPEPSRLARNIHQFMLLRDTLAAAGVKIEFLLDPS